jgi:hypothetical protein
MRHLRLLPFLLIGCIGVPDRWHVSGSRGYKDVEGPQGGAWSGDGFGLEIGVSGAIGVQETLKFPPRDVGLHPHPPAVSDEADIPWAEILITITAILGAGGGEVARRKGHLGERARRIGKKT